MHKIKEITPSNAYAMIGQGALLVDVRESREAEAKSFDVPEKMLIPLSDFGIRYQEIPLNHKVILACRSGNRSLMAASFLLDKGYSEVFNLQDGIMSWERAELPVKTTRQAGLISRIMPGFQRGS